jgi:hypothetical protein
LVGGEARVAPLVRSCAWSGEDASALGPPLDPAAARVVRDAWLADACMEHASIAAFGRFTLQLLALGAPADLVRDSIAAAADETLHAEACFAVAARVSGDAVGPGPLALEGALGAWTLVEVVGEVVIEGCVGETVAAILAARRHAVAGVPFVERALAMIAEDEARHAELAWRFLRWAIARGGDDVREVAARAFERALTQTTERVGEGVDGVDLSCTRAYGVLTSAEQRAAELEALEGVVAPCARLLLHSSEVPRVERGYSRAVDVS